MKDLTYVSPSDNTILIVSTTDSGNVYAMSLMEQREMGCWEWHWKQFVHPFWSLSENTHYLRGVWHWFVWKDVSSSFISSSNLNKILSTSGPHVSHRMRTDSSSRFTNFDSPPWPLMILFFWSCTWSRAMHKKGRFDLEKLNERCIIWWYTSGWVIGSEIKSKTWTVIQRE